MSLMRLARGLAHRLARGLSGNANGGGTPPAPSPLLTFGGLPLTFGGQPLTFTAGA